MNPNFRIALKCPPQAMFARTKRTPTWLSGGFNSNPRHQPVIRPAGPLHDSRQAERGLPGCALAINKKQNSTVPQSFRNRRDLAPMKLAEEFRKIAGDVRVSRQAGRERNVQS